MWCWTRLTDCKSLFSALERLFEVLKEYGTMFTANLWNLIFKGVILPIFIGVRVIAHEKSPVNEVRAEHHICFADSWLTVLFTSTAGQRLDSYHLPQRNSVVG